MSSAELISSNTRSSSESDGAAGISPLEELTQLEESILADVRRRRESEAQAAAVPDVKCAVSAPATIRTTTGIDIDHRQMTAYKWIMVGIAENLCPGFRVLPEQREALNDIFCYCMGIRTETIDPDRGLWLYGRVGAGKSTLLRVVKEFGRRVRSYDGRDYTFRITTASQIAGEYTNKGYAALNSYVDNRFQAIDDLGNEPQHLRFYGSEGEPLTYVLTMRYGQRREGDFTHVTTNLSMREITTRYGFRALDRIYEMFNIIHIPGRSFRSGL